MVNYRIWKNEDTDYFIVEIFNKCDLYDVQKQLIEVGYTILSVMNIINNDSVFMEVKIGS